MSLGRLLFGKLVDVRELERVSLCLLPTPMHRLDRLSDELGIDLWIKRDDLTGFAGGGNKGRKLEYLMGQAIAMGATAIVSCGASQSNFVRQLGAACAVCGLRCAVATMDSPYESLDRKVEGTLSRGGNVTLDHWFGIERHHFSDGSWDELESRANGLAQSLEAEGQVVMRVPLGGSSVEAVHAFVEAGREIDREFDWVVTASSSGSTHVGLAHAFQGSATQVLGVSADPEPEIVDDLLDLSARYAMNFGGVALRREEILFSLEFVGEGYGVPSEAGVGGMTVMAQREGILLDPIYSAKAFGGLLTLVARKEIAGRILFWHTGGIPALFAHEAAQS